MYVCVFFDEFQRDEFNFQEKKEVHNMSHRDHEN
jgi:hypothetical protein